MEIAAEEALRSRSNVYLELKHSGYAYHLQPLLLQIIFLIPYGRCVSGTICSVF